MKISAVDIIKHPVERVWPVLRDDLPKLADLLDDIESVTITSYKKTAHLCKVVNKWKALPHLPAAVMKHLKPTMLCWTDYAEWHEQKKECRWSIQFDYFPDTIRCSGTTTFNPAMGGRGTRVTFIGNADWQGQEHSIVPGYVGQAVYKSVEPLIRSFIPRNFRKLTAAVARYLDGESFSTTTRGTASAPRDRTSGTRK